MTVARIVENSAEQIRLGGVGEKLAREIESRTGAESRCTVLGHLQRGGSPSPLTAYSLPAMAWPRWMPSSQTMSTAWLHCKK